MNFEGEYNRDFKQLIQILNKILKQYVSQDKEGLSKVLGRPADPKMNVNIVLFPVSLLTPEELDALEDWLDQTVAEEDRPTEEFSGDLNASDLDFLRRNGIRY